MRITDPDVGVSIDVPVQHDGTFSQESKKDNVVSVATGKVSDETGNVYSVELVYDRRLYSAPGQFTSEKLETTFKAEPNAEVPIGKNPSKPQTEQSVADNALTNVTVKLLKGE
ncbi:hypothetical protein SH139x_004238 [Planctomycetaceae bacterium SH139]